MTALTFANKSSNITSATYDADSGILTITFNSGGTYEYHGVPQHLADEFATAASPGKFFHANIKGKYEAGRA